MASLIPGYEYDIFISYRQKDNKHDGWVTEFIENLKGELESTFKEDISVYYDINPHDGLRETHDIDASLKEKLKCLVFIPVLSRTYCDVKSFAWEHEFEVFVRMASEDRFGLKVRLPNGNIASRVLPVRIYDLDPSDVNLFESVTGGAIRSIDFVYSSAGVNRPLFPREEKPYENLNHTNYRDQINKVGNSLKEIINGMVHPYIRADSLPETTPSSLQQSKKPRKRPVKLISLIIGLLILPLAGIFLLPDLLTDSRKIDKTVAILPFFSDTPGDSSLYVLNMIFAGLLTHLQEINDLTPTSRTSAEKFRTTSNTIPEIARELGVNYIVETSGHLTDKTIYLTVALYKCTRKESRIWGQTIQREASDLFSIQSELAVNITQALNAVVTPREKKRLEKKPTTNLSAYEDYLSGRSFMNRYYEQGFDKAMQYFEQARSKDTAFALAYVGIGEVWVARAISSHTLIGEATKEASAAYDKAYQLDSTLAEVHVLHSWIRNYLSYDPHGAELSCRKALSISPNNVDVRITYANVLITLGRTGEALDHIGRALKLDPMNENSKGPYCVILFCARRYDDAIREFNELLRIDPANGVGLDNLPLALHMAERYDEALQVWESAFSIFFRGYPNMFKQRNTSMGYEEVLNLQGDSLSQNLKNKYINPTEIAQIYACAGNKVRTLDMLEFAYEKHDPNLPYVLRFPVYDFLKDDQRFLALFRKLKLDINVSN